MKNIIISLLICLMIGVTISKFLSIDRVEKNVLNVELLLLSGSNNFKLSLNNEEVEALYSLMEENKFRSNNSDRVMGYKGWRLVEINTVIFGYPLAESFLLEKFRGSLPEQVYSHIIEIMQNEYVEGENSPIYYPNNIHSTVCDETPIRGGDHYPEFNPQTDDKGCFIEKQWDNNCYNYGTDVLTNTFAQPGRGTSHKWVVNTCEDVKRAAISDGLIFKGDSFSEELTEGHYVAMFIWPNTNFHWVRLDNNGFWSHKAGGTPVKNVDNTGRKITDPSKSDFAPWTQFCGYFQVIPANININ